MIDGHGDPNTSGEYAEAIQALYSLSYTLKFALKKELGLVYRVARSKACGGPTTWPSSVRSARATGAGP